MSSPITVAVPSVVLEGVRKRWPERADAWAATVTAELDALCQRYRATPCHVLRARFGLVVKADSPAGPLIFRSSPDPDGADQAAVSVALAGLGVSPRIHEATTSASATWMVMDCVTPGVPIGDLGEPPSLGQIASMLQPLKGQPAPTRLPLLVDWLRSRLVDDDLADVAPGQSIAPADERRTATSLLDDLARDHVPSLCHGDASPWNILSGEAGQLHLIDPRGVAGALAYDVAVIAIKAAHHRPVALTAGALSDALGLSVDRTHAWVTVAEAARV